MSKSYVCYYFIKDQNIEVTEYPRSSLVQELKEPVFELANLGWSKNQWCVRGDHCVSPKQAKESCMRKWESFKELFLGELSNHDEVTHTGIFKPAQPTPLRARLKYSDIVELGEYNDIIFVSSETKDESDERHRTRVVFTPEEAIEFGNHLIQLGKKKKK